MGNMSIFRLRAALLEPRILLDAAALVTVADVAVDDSGNSEPSGRYHADAADSWASEAAVLLADSDAAQPATLGEHGEGLAEPAPLEGVHAVFDARLPSLDALIGALPPGVTVTVVQPDEDGLAAITRALEGQTGLQALHIFSHGAAGQITLGNVTVDLQLLDGAAAGAMAGWSAALAPGADLLLYGCSVGEGAEGLLFIDTIARLTGADVAASTDATGASAVGGN